MQLKQGVKYLGVSFWFCPSLAELCISKANHCESCLPEKSNWIIQHEGKSLLGKQVYNMEKE